jgi:asparagine synthase (glutamine-hydrolysing)
VDVGSYLSGGMDSGSITAVAARSNPDLMSFTVGFDMTSASGLELAFDERVQSEYLSYLCGTEHYEVVLKAGDMERCMKKLVWHMEEPRVGQSYPNYYASRLGSRFVKVILAGAGGDELFGGYPWRYYRAVRNSGFEDYVDKYYGFWQRLISNAQLPDVFAPIWADVKDVWTRDIFRDVFQHPAERLQTPEDYVNHSLYFEAKTFLHGLLVMEDKLSMAHSMETRLPFLDNDLVDLAMRVPVGLKLGNLQHVVDLDENQPGVKVHDYFNKTQDGKLILRSAMKSLLPQKVTGAVKQGFSAPDASWFRGESIDYVRDALFDRNAPIYDFLDYKAVIGMVQQHLSGEMNRRLLIWSLLYLNEWCHQFLGTKAV